MQGMVCGEIQAKKAATSATALAKPTPRCATEKAWAPLGVLVGCVPVSVLDGLMAAAGTLVAATAVVDEPVGAEILNGEDCVRTVLRDC